MVGIGASAGGLDALEKLFSAMPADSGLAFVVVQHLEPRHPSILAELLGRHTRMPARQAEDGVRPEPDHVYVIAPNTILTIERGALRVAPAPEESPPARIDALFRSLAEDRGEDAVGVILSGAGSDGSVGLRAVKEHGGLVLAQDPRTAAHGSMPQTAIEAGLVDQVLEIAQIPSALVAHARHLASTRGTDGAMLDADLGRSLRAICALLQQRTGHDFSRYKEGTLLRRIRRRVHIEHATSVSDYLRILSEDPGEPQRLLKDLLIGVTQFFRDPETFGTLQREILPRIVEGKPADVPVRIWVPGCASGEEAYSIAILVHEHLARETPRRFVQIFATDLDAGMVAEARAGRYSAEIDEHLSPERLERFFVRDGSGWHVGKELREMCIFSMHSLIRDPPFSALDLISCRNVLIYLEPDLQKQVIPLFHYALRRGGYLLLGPAEGLVNHRDLFETVDKKHRIFRRKETIARPQVEFPLSTRVPRSFEVPPPGAPSAPAPQQKATTAIERMLLDEYAPSCAVVNERGDIQFVAGRIGRFLAPPAGAPTTNLLDAVRNSLRVELRMALHSAATTGAKVIRDGVPVELEDAVHRVRLTVRPVPGAAGLFAVVVQERALEEVEGLEGMGATLAPAALEQIERELRTTRADLKTAVESAEAANEELRSSNEELISTNEELQSANEEMQTSKEELQSLNEELETVNTELQRNVEALRESEEHFRLLVEDVKDYAIFMLTPDGTVASWNVGAERLRGYRAEEIIGQSFARFYPEEDVRAGKPKQELEVAAAKGRYEDEGWRVRKDGSRFWASVVITAIRDEAGRLRGFGKVTRDFTERKAAERRLAYLASFPEENSNPIVEADLDGQVRYANPAALRLFPDVREKGAAHPWLSGWDSVRRSIQEGRTLARFREVAVGGRSYHQELYSMREEGVVRVYGLDITKRKRSEEALRESEQRYSAIYDKSPFAIALTRMPEGITVGVNDAFLKLFEYTRDEVVGKASADLGISDPDSRTRVAAELRARGSVRDFEATRTTKSGARRLLSINLDWVAIGGEKLVLTTIQDITERKRSEEALRQATQQERFLAEVIENATTPFGVGAPDGRLLLFNRSFAELTGYSREELEQRRLTWITDLTPPEWREREAEILGKASRTGETARYEKEYIRKDGSRVPIELFVQPVLDSKGNVIQYRSFLTDITERKRADEERARLATIVVNSDDAIISKDLSGTIQSWNVGAERLFGYTAEEIIGRPIALLLPPEQQNEEDEILRRLRAGKRVEHYETVRVAKDQRRVEVSVTASPLTDGQGRIIGASKIARDISARKQAEEGLRDSEQRFRTMANAIPQLAWIAKPDGYIYWYNQRWHEYTGTTPAQMEGWGWQTVHDPAALPKVLEKWKASIETGVPFDMVFPLRGADGRFRPFLTRVMPLKDSEGRVAQWFGTNTDVSERTEAEEALRESEAKYRLLFHNMLAGFAHCRMLFDDRRRPIDFIYLDVNDSFTRLTGLKDVAGKRVTEVIPAIRESNPEMFEIYGRVASTGQPERFEIYLEPLDIWFSIAVYSPEKDHFVAVFDNITDRKRAEEALRESEERFRALVTASSDVVYRMSPDWSEMRQLRGRGFIADTEAPNRTWLQEYIHRDDQPHVMAVISEAIRTRSIFQLEHRVLRVDGSVGWTFSRAIPLQGANGDIVEWFGAASDVTDRKRAEEDLTRSRHGLSRLAEASLRVVRETDLEGMLQAVSEAALALTGARNATCGHGYVSGRFMVGGSARAPGAPVCPPGNMFLVEKGGVHMDLVETAEAIRLTDAELRDHPSWWGLSEEHVPLRGLLGVRMVGRNGQPSGLLLVTDKEQGEFSEEDESLLRQLATIASLALQHVEARISLEESDRSKNQFLAMLSHELRNPLAPIRNSLYILDRAAPGGDQARHAHAVIDRQVGHLTRLVDDLLDVTRISRGKIQLRRERLDLCDVVHRAIEDDRWSFERSSIELQVSVPEVPLWIDGDRTRIAQVIGNLLHNSAKFTQPGGEAAISVEANERVRQAIVRMRDTGVGIAPEMLPRVFEPFAQADSTLDRSKGGLGLGLALVKGLVEMHGGTVSVESEGLGKGAEFTVRLPLESAELPAAAPVRNADAAGPRRVLVIEDNVDAAETLREALELGKHTVEVAFSGAEGIEKARAFRPDVVLCDIGLPGTDGYQVARTMRADPALRATRLVALTGYAGPEDVARSREAGFDFHLAKPPTLEKIEEALAPRADDAQPARTAR